VNLVIRSLSVQDLVLDLLVPARLASRYRARLEALSMSEAELHLTFCPSIFRSGDVASCPAEISLSHGRAAVRLRGSFSIERGPRDIVGHLRFAPAPDAADVEVLRKACALDAIELGGGGPRILGPEDAPRQLAHSLSATGFYPTWLRPVAV
jgi:hypothetical protein